MWLLNTTTDVAIQANSHMALKAASIWPTWGLHVALCILS